MSEVNIIHLPNVSSEIEISKDWIAERDSILAEAGKINSIQTKEAFAEGGDLLKRITKTSNAMERFRKDFAEPYQDAVKLIKRASDLARKPLEDAKNELQGLLNAYAAEQARKAADERQRIEAQQRKAIEAQIEAQRKAEDAADALGLDEPAPVPEPVAPVIVPKEERARADTVRVSESVTWNVRDEDAIPSAFKMLDPRKVNAWAAMNKDRVMRELKDAPEKAGAFVPGIEFRIETKVISR